MNIETNTEISRQWHESFGTPNLKSAFEKFLAKDFRALFLGHGWVDKDVEVLIDFFDAPNEKFVTSKPANNQPNHPPKEPS